MAYSMILQIPPEVPNPHEGELFNIQSPLDIVIYFVIPALIIAYFFWRRR